VEQIGPHRWILLADLAFYSRRYPGLFVAPRGFQTDFASIPLLAGTVLPKTGAYNPVAVIHDAGYMNALLTEMGSRIYTVKQVADTLFAEGLEAVGVPWWRRALMVRVVRWFGDPLGHPGADLEAVGR
jgi:hypothetical protein